MDLFRTNLSGSWNAREVPVRHDAAGNLVFDGTFIYHYDAWNRLVQVSAGAVNPSVSPVADRPYIGLVAGVMIKHHTYDGLGRLIRTQSPFPTPLQAAQGKVRSERFYYDGIRRIQETRLDPASNLGTALASEDSQEQQAAQTALTQTEAAVGYPEQVEIDAAAAPLGLENELLALPATEVLSLAREYVWGPGDAWHPATVDELLCYYGEQRTAYWPLHDASGDIAAVCVPGVTGQAYARVAAQMRYDAYGQVLSADYLLPHVFLAAGHKGLFFDRLDRGVADPLAPGTVTPPGGFTTETPRLIPFARGVYHVRNRAMVPGGGSPTLIGAESLTCANPPACSTWTLSQSGLGSGAAVHGRFMQADPNATGMVLQTGLTYHGRAGVVVVDRFDLETRFVDGANVYQYLGASCWTSSDPLGLFFGLLDLGVASTTTSGLQSQWNDRLLESGVAAMFGVGVMLSGYSMDQEQDMDWALDWSQPDNAFSRSGIMSSVIDLDYEADDDEEFGPFEQAVGGTAIPRKMLAGVKTAIKAFKTRSFHLGQAQVTLDKGAMRHILQRHHRRYFDPGQRKPLNTFFPDNCTPNDIAAWAQRAVLQNVGNIKTLKNGTSTGALSARINGREHLFYIKNWRLTSFFPKDIP